MVDKIYGGKGFAPLGSVGYAGKAGVTKKFDTGVKTGDRVDFSSALQEASKAQESSSMQETARAERIQALKSQIENGTYLPDLEKVASSLLPFIMKDV